MSDRDHYQRLAEKLGRGESPAVRRILQAAMTEEEARFLADLPASAAALAGARGIGGSAIEERLLGLTRRGLVMRSPDGLRFPESLVMLHDGIMSSAPEYVPEGIDKLWMELYDGEGWVNDIGHAFASQPRPAIRAVPTPASVGPDTVLLPQEDLAVIFRAHADLIAVRPCCCRAAAKKCDHPTQTCVQMGSRGEFELRRGSSKKISSDEATTMALAAVESGLVPMTFNSSDLSEIDFVCFCCGCCCICLNSGQRIGALHTVVAPSRFVSTVVDDKCIACEECIQRCTINAIAMHAGVAAVDSKKCLGCGACIAACPIEGGMAMELIRPPEFIAHSVSQSTMNPTETPLSTTGHGH